MPARSFVSIFLALALLALTHGACRGRDSNIFVIVQSDNISTLDPVGSPTVDAASERVRVLMFNSLMRKNEKFEYVNELASEMPKVSEDGLSITFTLRDNVKFHDGRPLTSADAKYTLDTMLASTSSGKAASFFEGSGANKQSFITSVEAPDARTLIIRLRKRMPQLFPNLVTVGIIPQGTAAQHATSPLGSGPYRFKSFDKNQQVLDLEANENYWEGAPNIKALRVRVIADANALQAELKSGRVDIVPLPTNLTPDAIVSLGKDANLKVEQFPGSNIVYLGFNVQSPTLDKVAVRQAIAFGIDRERLIRELLLGQAKLAHSILPEESWAYTQGQTYSYNPERAKKILDDAGFRDPDGSGPQMRFQTPIIFKVSSGSIATRQYATVMQNSLKEIGIPVEIETIEFNSLLQQLRQGQFQMTTSRWVGGNQDPIFLRNLFTSAEIPTQERPGLNRSRYSNPAVDKILDEAFNTTDQQRAGTLYKQAQEIISQELPMMPLWYPANVVIARRSVGNIKIDGSGDWGFVRNLTFENK